MEGEFPQPHSVLSLPSLHYQNLFTSRSTIPLRFAHLPLLHFFPFSSPLLFSFFLPTPSTTKLDTQSLNSSHLGLLPVRLFFALAQFSHTNVRLPLFRSVDPSILALAFQAVGGGNQCGVPPISHSYHMAFPDSSLFVACALFSFFLSFTYFQY